MRSESTRLLSTFVRELLKQWWVAAFAVLSFLSTLATYAPSYLPHSPIPKWLPPVVFAGAFFVAANRVFRRQVHQIEMLNTELNGSNEKLKKLGKAERLSMKAAEDWTRRVAELQSEVERLRVKPYDEEKLKKARQLIESLFADGRDLLRFLLLHGRTSGQRIFQGAKLDSQVVGSVLQTVEQKALIVRYEKVGSGIAYFEVHPAWQEVFRDILFPRSENTDDPSFH